MTEINTRPPSQNEYSLMENLYKEMYELIDSSPPPVEWVTNVYEQSMSGERNYWLALLDSKIVGFVDFKVIPFHQGSEQKFARIFDLFITPSVQRYGYGAQLARKVISSAIEQGAISIEINVLPDNKAALDFWQSLGFSLHLYALKMTL
ncbi:MAG TPA: GNAT family N-acetyltransferase [Leptolyngbyaceae cyanobacterium]